MVFLKLNLLENFVDTSQINATMNIIFINLKVTYYIWGDIDTLFNEVRLITTEILKLKVVKLWQKAKKSM